jgi:hypothetical protein
LGTKCDSFLSLLALNKGRKCTKGLGTLQQKMSPLHENEKLSSRQPISRLTGCTFSAVPADLWPFVELGNFSCAASGPWLEP